MFGIASWLWIFLFVGAVSLGLFLGPLSARAKSRWGVAVAALHPLTSVGLFYSLAVHMHREGVEQADRGERVQRRRGYAPA